MADNTSNPTVSTKEVDFLCEDKQIRGQNYALLSFISPEDVLKNKEVFYFHKFLDQFSKDMNTLYNGILSKYPDAKDLIDTLKSNHSYISDENELNEQYNFFKSVNSQDIESEFHKNNNFTTSMRGIKVRGVFDTMEEAKLRSEFIKKTDSKFDIYIAQVGCWCPWSPNPNDLQDQEFSETQLNTLMKQYKQNMDSKDQLFEDRKNAQIEISKNKTDTSDIVSSIEGVDPWMKAKEEDKEEDTENKIIV